MLNSKALLQVVLFFIVVGLIAGCGQKTADLVITNGKIVTMDVSNPEAQAMAISGDKILAVGSNEEIEDYMTEGLRSKGQRAEVCLNSWPYDYRRPPSRSRCTSVNLILPNSIVQEYGSRVAPVEPEHATTTASVKNQRAPHPSASNSLKSVVGLNFSTLESRHNSQAERQRSPASERRYPRRGIPISLATRSWVMFNSRRLTANQPPMAR